MMDDKKRHSTVLALRAAADVLDPPKRKVKAAWPELKDLNNAPLASLYTSKTIRAKKVKQYPKDSGVWEVLKVKNAPGFEGYVAKVGETVPGSYLLRDHPGGTLSIGSVSHPMASAVSAAVSAAKLTKQHFVAMAKAIAQLSNPADRKMMLDALAPMLMASNPRFDMERFKKAAKVSGSRDWDTFPDAIDQAEDLLKTAEPYAGLTESFGDLVADTDLSRDPGVGKDPKRWVDALKLLIGLKVVKPHGRLNPSRPGDTLLQFANAGALRRAQKALTKERREREDQEDAWGPGPASRGA